LDTMKDILRHYQFGADDESRLATLAEVLSPEADALAEAFYQYLASDPYTAAFFSTPAEVERRKSTMRNWFRDLFTGPYDQSHLRRLERVGKVHVKIGLSGHYVNAAMHFVREFCHQRVAKAETDPAMREALVGTLNKILDVHLDILSSSYREAELGTVFLSRRFESGLVRWAERLVHGLNLVLMVGLLAMAIGVLSLFVADVINAFSTDLEGGVIRALGSLLILWMMIELLQAEVDHLRGGRFHVRIFLELALVAFIRKLFIAALENKDPINFGLILAGLLVLGLLFFLMARSGERSTS